MEITDELLHPYVQRNPLSFLEKPKFERILRSQISKKICCYSLPALSDFGWEFGWVDPVL